jgi:hypothetical protein
MSGNPLPLAEAAIRLRGRPGRPRKTPPDSPPLVEPVRRLLDLDAAATYLSCSTWTVRDLEAAGVLPRVRIPTRNGRDLRKLLFDREDLDALIVSWKEGRA